MNHAMLSVSLISCSIFFAICFAFTLRLYKSKYRDFDVILVQRNIYQMEILKLSGELKTWDFEEKDWIIHNPRSNKNEQIN